MGTYLFIHNSTHKILLYLHPDPLSIQLSNSLINFWILSCTIWAISLVLNTAINDVFKLRLQTFPSGLTNSHSTHKLNFTPVNFFKYSLTLALILCAILPITYPTSPYNLFCNLKSTILLLNPEPVSIKHISSIPSHLDLCASNLSNSYIVLHLLQFVPFYIREKIYSLLECFTFL